MARSALVPRQLTRGPFTVEEARRAGLAMWHLEGASWRRLARGSYVWSGLAESSMHRLEAARRRLPNGAAFTGLTAAWLHGLDVPPCDPIEAVIPIDAGVSGRAGIAVRRSTLPRGDLVTVRGMPATSIARSIADASARIGLVETVVVVDAAVHNRLIKLAQLERWVAANRGRHGIRTLRRAIELAEPAAESPMESRLRLVLILSGLPRPQAQVSITDHWGRFVGRPDLYYEKARLGIEYDGGIHRDKLAEDNRRQNALLKIGVRLLRFTAADVLANPALVVAQVRAVLTDSARTAKLPANSANRAVGTPKLPAIPGYAIRYPS